MNTHKIIEAMSETEYKSLITSLGTDETTTPVRQLTNSQKRELIKLKLSETPHKSDRQIAEILGVSNSTVSITRKKMIENGQLCDSHISVGIDGRKRHRPGIESNKTPISELTDTSFEVRCDDIKSGLTWIGTGSVDAVICDPPYGKEHIELYAHIGKVSARVLRDGGSLIIMCGQSHLPRIMTALGKHLRYNWLVSYVTPRGSKLLQWCGVMPRFKAVLWYVKGAYKGRYVSDVVACPPQEADEGELHKWQQSVGGFERLVSMFSSESETVLDLCCGSGTTGVAAVRLGRKFIGCDIDPTCIEITRRRIAEMLEEEKVVK